jgi:queuine tRNA-ribosyltransferase
MLKIISRSKKSQARVTKLTVSHGSVMAPFFMPVGTRASVKYLTPDDLQGLGSEIVLSNTYHLMIAPTTKVIKKAKGLHGFMNWQLPILTDSGGFQVFSLSKIRKVTEHGVIFTEPKSGKAYELTPESSMRVQLDLGVDIAMAFDDVIGYPATKDQVKDSMERTSRWAKRCLDYHQKNNKIKQKLFGIIQGGTFADLRDQSITDLTAMDFDGFAVGGVAVGEPREKLKDILTWTVEKLPANKPRYLMGLGRPEEIVLAVKHGIDMFDCVIPTREARHGRLYLWNGKTTNLNSKNFYKTINIQNAKYKNDFSPINNITLKKYSKAYLHHLFKVNEPLGMRLATLNNVGFYVDLMKKIRVSIKRGEL